MHPIDYYKSAELAIAKFNPILKEMFPNMVTARVKYFMGQGSVTIDVISPWKVTKHNADVNFTVMLHLTTSFGQVEGIEKFSLENLSIPRKFKYRKMSAKSPYMVIAKFVKWLETNKELINKEIRNT